MVKLAAFCAALPVLFAGHSWGGFGLKETGAHYVLTPVALDVKSLGAISVGEDRHIEDLGIGVVEQRGALC